MNIYIMAEIRIELTGRLIRVTIRLPLLFLITASLPFGERAGRFLRPDLKQIMVSFSLERYDLFFFSLISKLSLTQSQEFLKKIFFIY